MNPAVAAASLAGAVVAPVLVYLLGVRRAAGKVDVSEASQLWEESKTMRQELQARIGALEAQVDALHVMLDSLRQELATERAQVESLRREREDLLVRVRDLEAHHPR